MAKMYEVTASLELTLGKNCMNFSTDNVSSVIVFLKFSILISGPDTSDLAMRMGLHSGPVTAGVLRVRCYKTRVQGSDNFPNSVFVCIAVGTQIAFSAVWGHCEHSGEVRYCLPLLNVQSADVSHCFAMIYK